MWKISGLITQQCSIDSAQEWCLTQSQHYSKDPLFEEMHFGLLLSYIILLIIIMLLILKKKALMFTEGLLELLPQNYRSPFSWDFDSINVKTPVQHHFKAANGVILLCSCSLYLSIHNSVVSFFSIHPPSHRISHSVSCSLSTPLGFNHCCNWQLPAVLVHTYAHALSCCCKSLWQCMCEHVCVCVDGGGGRK